MRMGKAWRGRGSRSVKVLLTGCIVALIAHGCGHEARRQAGETAVQARPTDVTAPDQGFWLHGPYAAGECSSCHDLSSPDTLTLPVQALCVHCHAEHGAEAAQARGLRLHEPALEGRCTACHHPHLAPRRYMLLAADNQALCARCHDRAALLADPAHMEAPGEDCLACHNAHVGTTPALLTSDFDEVRRLYEGM
jgi:predicted CXXCH cytochrome family protein